MPEVPPSSAPLYRWYTLVTAFVVLLTAFSFGLFSLPVSYPSLTRQFGWTHAEAAAGGSIVLLLLGGLGPVIGWLADRYSPKTVLLAGTCIAALSLALLARSEDLRAFYGSCLILGLASAAVSLLPTSLLIAPSFSNQRGLAVGAVDAGVGLGGFLTPLLAGTLIRTGGTSHAFELLSFCMVVPLLMILPLFWSRSGKEGFTKAALKTKRTYLQRGAGATRLLWLLGITLFFASHSMMGVQQHLVLFLTGHGVGPGRSALALSVLLGASTLGRILGGAAADRFSARVSLLLSVVCLVVGIIGLLVISASSYLILLISGIFGLGFGGVFNSPPLIAFEYFGIEDVGTMVGWFMLFFGVGASSGSLVSGLIYDRAHAYSLSFEFDLAVVVLALFPLLAVGRRHEITEPSPVAPE